MRNRTCPSNNDKLKQEEGVIHKKLSAMNRDGEKIRKEQEDKRAQFLQEQKSEFEKVANGKAELEREKAAAR